jgi:hypothetical protein
MDDGALSPIDWGYAARGEQDDSVTLFQTADKRGDGCCGGFDCLITTFEGINKRFQVVENEQGTGAGSSLQDGLLQCGSALIVLVGGINPIEAGQAVIEAVGKGLADNDALLSIDSGEGLKRVRQDAVCLVPADALGDDVG